MAFPIVTNLTFEEEQRLNDSKHSFTWVAERYRESMLPERGHGLYEWEPIQFANTQLVNQAATHFKKFKRYTDIEPTSRHWKLWWDREEYRRKHGITLPIKVPEGGALSDKDLLPLWIPGRMYGHLNYGPIKKTLEPGQIGNVKEAIGQSIEVAEALHKEKQLVDLFAGLSDKKVASKDYDFPDFWDGHFHTYLAIEFARRLGLDFETLKARRKGFSYVGGWIAADTYDLYPNSLVLLIAYDIKYLNKGKEALFNMVVNYADFLNKHTDWYKGRLINNTTNIKSGYTINGEDGEFGFKSEVMCLSAMDNPDCARGKDADLILYEECGSFPNLIPTKDTTKAAAETGGYVVGQSLYWGTAGKNEGGTAGLATIHYDPFTHDCLPFRNKWSRIAEIEASGQFFGQYQNLIGEAIDKNGNSNADKAKEIDDKTDLIKQRDKKNYYRWRAERARTPEEALSPMTNNIFAKYSDGIRLQIERLNTTLKNIGSEGKYLRDSGKVRMVLNGELLERGLAVHPAIDDVPELLPKDMDKHGCIVEWATPFMQYSVGDGPVVQAIPDNLYVIWHDPFATNKEEEEITLDNSYGVAYVYELPNAITATKGGRIVASLIGRPDTTDAYNEQLFLMAERWNAKILYENDRGVVYEYALPRRLTRWLIEEPEMLSMKDISGKTGRRYGVSIGKHPQRLPKGLLMLHDFLGAQLGVDLFGNPTTFVQSFNCKRGLRELLRYGKKGGNYDCVSTLVVGQYCIQEYFDIEIRSRVPELNLDDFWNRSFFSN